VSLQTSADIGADEAATMRCIALRAATTLGVEATWADGGVALRYPEPMSHPWPRAVELSVEVFASSLEALAELRSAALTRPDEPNRAYLFGDIHAHEISAAGYDLCWTMPLLCHDLSPASSTPASDLQIEVVETCEQVAELNALRPEYPSYEATLGLRGVHRPPGQARGPGGRQGPSRHGGLADRLCGRHVHGRSGPPPRLWSRHPAPPTRSGA
jgi:hypothetical protein